MSVQAIRTGIYESAQLARTFCKGLKARGLREGVQKFDNVFAHTHTGGWYNEYTDEILLELEKTSHKGMVTARDTYRPRAIGKPRLLSSQQMSETGDIMFIPGRRGFLGIGKQEPYFQASQAIKRGQIFGKTVDDDIFIKAQGTLENPVNPMAFINGSETPKMISVESAKEFIAKLLKGENVSKYSIT